MNKVILASQSPRRQELLGRLVSDFAVCPADIDETMDSALLPEQAVLQLAKRKAAAVLGEHPDAVVIAADTIVVCDEIFGKPSDEADAARMLRELSGRAHQVMTAVSVMKGDRECSDVSVTDVHFRQMDEDEIQGYIATGEPMDKAGAYGIQGFGARFIERIEGDYYGVMGLPVCMLHQLLKQIEQEGENG